MTAAAQAALRLAVIAEVREAASCGSDDGDQCPKCTRHADAILAALAAQEPEPAPGDGCPIEAVLPDGHHSCTLRRGHEGGHDFADEGGFADEREQAAPALAAATVLAEVLDFLDGGIPPGDEFALQVAQWRKRGLAS